VYWHHGIYCGDDAVIHFNSAVGRKRTAKIVETTLEKFSGGAGIRVVVYEKVYFEAAEVVCRARSLLGNEAYDLRTNNCEHFAVWCKTGVSQSRQMEHLALFATRGGLVGSRIASKMMAPVVARMGAKVAPKIAGTFSRLASQSVATNPLNLVPIAAQILVEKAGPKLGLSKEKAESVGAVIGAGGSVAFGAGLGGPVGAFILLGIWTIGEGLAPVASGYSTDEV
jgi:hypothetical protein